ncbi:MAG: Uma2 family endonuclease [Tannerella sp.]|jgi:Uma2 family endonuclease|nr:Uma2 family endonuclease [Tannerella sp.]
MELRLDIKKRYTYADYLTWVDHQARELLNGFIRLMSPAPTLTHAKITRTIFFELEHYVRKNNGKCQVFTAPLDVRLTKKPGEVEDDQIDTVVQPDLCIVCDESKLDERGCLGAPDMVVEITSLSSQKYDWNEKFNLYESSGVKEYWVVSPKEKGVNVFLLQEDGKYDRGVVYEGETEVPVKTLAGLRVSLGTIFNP